MITASHAACHAPGLEDRAGGGTSRQLAALIYRSYSGSCVGWRHGSCRVAYQAADD